MKIGYQGDCGSNSEIAAKQFIKKNNHKAELVPLISSKNVVKALKNKEIDLGVMALENNIGGVVEETKKAVDNNLQIVSKIKVIIHHCLFIKKKDINISTIKYVASHQQALLQTTNTINRIFHKPILVSVEDTAISAKYFNRGKLSQEYAIICSKQAGVDNGLHLIQENIEDKKSVTTFGLFSLK